MNLDYLTNLNENQEKAVLHLNGPLLIVAGAGSGKTRVLTARIAHIVKQHKAFPNQVLAVTFTNKAANEMQLRVSKFLRKEATGLPTISVGSVGLDKDFIKLYAGDHQTQTVDLKTLHEKLNKSEFDLIAVEEPFYLIQIGRIKFKMV